MITYILFLFGFIFLIKGADFLVKGASSLAKRFKASDLVVGLTIVAFGTSAPELFVNVVAAIQGKTSIAVGNIVGSNIFNILIILGISAVVYPLTVTVSTVSKEIPMCFLASILVWILGNDMFIDRGSVSAITRIDGFVLFTFFIVFLYHIFSMTKIQRERIDSPQFKDYSVFKIVLLIAAGFAMLFSGSKFVVDGAVKLAGFLGVSESTMGLTVVACGTSVPELATSVVAASRKNTDIAVGNIVGSNIFNIFFILAASAVINPLVLIPVQDNISIAVSIFASLLLFIVMFSGRKRFMIERWEGILFIIAYIAFISFLIICSPRIVS
jgi:cation:H+ antiporter